MWATNHSSRQSVDQLNEKLGTLRAWRAEPLRCVRGLHVSIGNSSRKVGAPAHRYITVTSDKDDWHLRPFYSDTFLQVQAIETEKRNIHLAGAPSAADLPGLRHKPGRLYGSFSRGIPPGPFRRSRARSSTSDCDWKVGGVSTWGLIHTNSNPIPSYTRYHRSIVSGW